MPKEKGKDSKILRRLGEWKQKNGTLPQFVEIYAELLRLKIELKARLIVPKPDLSEKAVADQLRQGIPLLRIDDLLPHWPLVEEQFQAVISILARHLADEPEEAQGLGNIASNAPLLQQIVRDWYQGLPLSSVATEEHVSENLLSATIQAALRPFLSAHSEVLLKSVKQELWRRKHCPVCGGKPDFASLDRERGARWLLCSRCDAQWLFQRLECPYCGTQNQDSLAYFTDDEELYRLYICEECRSYIKIIDLRRTNAEILLPLERIVTVDMDRQAEESGYQAGWTNATPLGVK